MAGIFSVIGKKNGNNILDEMVNAKFYSKHINVESFNDENISISISSLSQEQHIFKTKTIIICFEGYFLNLSYKNEDLLRYLKEQYIQKGIELVSELYGSFLLMITEIESNKTFIFSDQTSSRPCYYSICEGVLLLAPEINSLVKIIGKNEANINSIINFMISGYCQRGETLAKDVFKLSSGEYLEFENNTIKKNSYFSYSFKNITDFSKMNAIDELNRTLNGVIMDCWRKAKNPAILLSGGLDSRYIFYTIVQNVSDTSKITTVTWGVDNQLKGSDFQIAKELSKQFNTNHIEIEKNIDSFSNEFDDMFFAQSGMTDATLYHSSELSVCKVLREKYGIEELFRGDECFGFLQEKFTKQGALKAIDMSELKYIEHLSNWFTDDFDVKDKFSPVYLSKRYKSIKENELKDELYFNERINMLLQPFNFFKYYYLEIYNPLIDPRILNLINKIPSKYRHDKKLFKLCYEEKFKKVNKVNFAVRDNLINWDIAISLNKDLQLIITDSMKLLPHYFNIIYFKTMLLGIINIRKRRKKLQIVKHSIRKIIKLLIPNKIKEIINTKHNPPNFLMISRIVVISKWYNNWLKKEA